MYDTFISMTSQFKKSNNTGSAIKVAALSSVIVVVFSLLTGCGSTGSKQALSAAVSDYNAMNYSSAQRKASQVAKKSNGTLKDQAAYLSGLSAYKLGDLVEAELQLSKAVRSKDQTTAARAKAVLGLIRVDQDRPGDAAGLLSEASISMQGEDSRRGQRHRRRLVGLVQLVDGAPVAIHLEGLGPGRGGQHRQAEVEPQLAARRNHLAAQPKRLVGRADR